MAAAAADDDNDGDPDWSVACGGWGKSCPEALYCNDGVDAETGRVVFVDGSEQADIGTESRHGFGVALGDHNNDGFLDVYISNKFDPNLF